MKDQLGPKQIKTITIYFTASTLSTQIFLGFVPDYVRVKRCSYYNAGTSTDTFILTSSNLISQESVLALYRESELDSVDYYHIFPPQNNYSDGQTIDFRILKQDSTLPTFGGYAIFLLEFGKY